MSRRYFHFLCVLLLLVAQQGALFHATWHAGGDARAHKSYAHIQDTARELPVGPVNQNKQSSQRNLCAFDLAFGQVLGGVQGSCAPPVTAELPAALTAYPFNPRPGTESVPALARGPPILS